MFGSSKDQAAIAGLEAQVQQLRESLARAEQANQLLRDTIEQTRAQLDKIQNERISELKLLHDRATGRYVFSDPPFDPSPPREPRSGALGSTQEDRLRAYMRSTSVFGEPDPPEAPAEARQAAPDPEPVGAEIVAMPPRD